MNDLRKQKVSAVEAFVTFESHETADRAVAASQNFGTLSGQSKRNPNPSICPCFGSVYDMCIAGAGIHNGQTCELRVPPEPESLHWYSFAAFWSSLRSFPSIFPSIFYGFDDQMLKIPRDRLEIQPFEQTVRQALILAATLTLLLGGFAAVVQADILKGNTAYLGGCDDAMSPTLDRHDSSIVHQ